MGKADMEAIKEKVEKATKEEEKAKKKEMKKKMKAQKESFWKDFKKFITKGNIIDMAVGVVIGSAFSAIVNGLVKMVINPCIALIPGAEKYDAFKLLNWEADQGFAHNGIIYSMSSDPDVHKYDVSDTMVFGKKIALFFAECCDIPKNEGAQSILNRINSATSNKFAFIDGEGNLFTMGTFEYKDGVAYSNSSYIERSWKRSSSKSYSFNTRSLFSDYYDDDYYGGPYSSYGKNYSNVTAFPESKSPAGNSKDTEKTKDTKDTKKSEKLKRAEEMGLTILKKDAMVWCFDEIECIDGLLLAKLKYAYSDSGILYYWNKVSRDWEIYSAPENGFALIDEESAELIFNCFDMTDEDLMEVYDGWFTGGEYLPESSDQV